MAFNANTLKNLFSKLKPAAKTVANYGDDAAKALTTYGDDVAQMAFANADDLAELASLEQLAPNVGTFNRGLPSTSAEWDELTDALNNPEIMDYLDWDLYFGNKISNFDNTSSYVDQLLHPTPNWTSRFGEVLSGDDARLQNLHKRLIEHNATWKNFQSTYGFVPSHVNLDDISNQLSKLRKVRDQLDFGDAGFE